ncbi:unnamed protein product [Lactuca saligna]|uniref:Uncharacterized protein n=1 Tax=Lactuca saligna TaxID=75948 RepID=A0AA35Z5M0_LACSI|nr:unnamed protein product [Lactuca saligna]
MFQNLQCLQPSLQIQKTPIQVPSTGGKKQFSSQGNQGNFSKNEGSGVFAGNRKQGQKGNYPKIGNFGASDGIRYQGYNGNNQENLEFSFDRGGKTGGKNGQGYYGNIQPMKGKSNDSKIEQGKSWKSNKVMGKNKDGGDVLEVKGFVGNNSMSRPDQEAKKSEAGVIWNIELEGLGQNSYHTSYQFKYKTDLEHRIGRIGTKLAINMN